MNDSNWYGLALLLTLTVAIATAVVCIPLYQANQAIADRELDDAWTQDPLYRLVNLKIELFERLRAVREIQLQIMEVEAEIENGPTGGDGPGVNDRDPDDFVGRYHYRGRTKRFFRRTG